MAESKATKTFKKLPFRKDDGERVTFFLKIEYYNKDHCNVFIEGKILSKENVSFLMKTLLEDMKQTTRIT